MNTETEKKLWQLAAGELSDLQEQELRKMLAADPMLREKFQLVLNLHQSLYKSVEEPAPAGFTDKTISKLEQKLSARQVSILKKFAPGKKIIYIVAACFLVLVIISGLFNSGESSPLPSWIDPANLVPTVNFPVEHLTLPFIGLSAILLLLIIQKLFDLREIKNTGEVIK